jgi:hypothetical protein
MLSHALRLCPLLLAVVLQVPASEPGWTSYKNIRIKPLD